MGPTFHSLTQSKPRLMALICCEPLQPAELEALAGQALKAALAEEPYERGVVVDGLNSQYLSPDMAAHLLLASLGLQKSCKLPILQPAQLSLGAPCVCKHGLLVPVPKSAAACPGTCSLQCSFTL